MIEAYAGPVPCGSCRRTLPPDAGDVCRCVCGSELRIYRFRPFRRQSKGPAGASGDSDTPCAYHARNQSVAACARCGSFLCSLCSTALGRETYCPPCFERLRATGALPVLRNRFPRPHALALTLAFGALFPGFGVVLVPFVIWQSLRALRDMDALAERESGIVLFVVGAGLLSLASVAIAVAFARSILKAS